MITGELRNRIDSVWDAFWSGGISNPLEVIQQITYLLFLRRLDEAQTLAERRADLLGEPVEHPVYSNTQQPLRWSVLKNDDPDTAFTNLRLSTYQVPSDGVDRL